MTKRQVLAALAGVLVAVSFGRAAAADISGTWKAAFDTQIGRQAYTYELVVKDSTVTGKASSDNGETTLTEGKVEGDKVSFVEMLNFQGMEIRIVYTGTIVSPDEIKFTRQVADFATEELVATRVKDAKDK
jgi:hypothetical protein